MADPNFGIRLEAGKQVDLSKLFEENEFKEAISKAKSLTALQHANIEANTAKIQNYVRTHPDEAITNDKVSEILSSEAVAVEDTPIEVETPAGTSPEDFAETNIESPGLTVNNEVPAEAYELPDEVETDVTPPNSDENLNNLNTDKKIKPDDYLRTVSNEHPLNRSMAGDASFAQSVESAFRQDIDSVYGSKGFMGIGKVEGVDSKYWGLMKGLNASEVVKYYTGDSMHTKFPLNIAKQLADTERHHTFAKQMLGLMGEAGASSKPYENENIDQFIKRLGGVVMKKHLEKVA